jgi:hypothetical protein
MATRTTSSCLWLVNGPGEADMEKEDVSHVTCHVTHLPQRHCQRSLTRTRIAIFNSFPLKRFSHLTSLPFRLLQYLQGKPKSKLESSTDIAALLAYLAIPNCDLRLLFTRLLSHFNVPITRSELLFELRDAQDGQLLYFLVPMHEHPTLIYL